MASDLDRDPAGEDTALLSTTDAEPDAVTQTGDQWPVADLYYVAPGEGAASESAALEPDAAAAAPPAMPARRRPVPSFDLGLLLAAIAVAAALAAGALFLVLDEDPAASTRPSAATPPTEPPETTTPPPADAQIDVAAVEGMTLAEARAALEDQGLRVRVTRSPAESPRGEVLSQEPPPGSKAVSGTVIALVVSDGTTAVTKRVEVPDVTDLSASRAVATLREAGLAARIHLVRSSERPGLVLSQRPDAGAEVATNVVVQLEVAKAQPAAQRVEVPDVVGLTAAAARRKLRTAGLTVEMVSAASQEPVGMVIEQAPRAGSELRKAGRVTLTVSSGPATIDVPDVTGLDEGSAIAQLERAGFQVRVTDESTTDPMQDGTVLRQTPQGGSSAEEGAIVTITVAHLD